MIILIITIILLILGIALFIIGIKTWEEVSSTIGGMLIFITFIVLVAEGLILILKPLDYKKFITKYETVTETITNENDVRDTDYTKMIIDINKEIRTNRKFIDSKWIGIFYDKDIAEMELINKGGLAYE